MSTNRPGAGFNLQLYVPKLVTLLRRGYGFGDFRHDLVAGLTVAIVALPLAMALAIASGASPEKGLYTAIVAGFLISLLGGSRVQVGGPTAAFIPVVFNVIDKFGFGGLILCTLIAGVMLILAGVLRLGILLRYIPQPVVTGFTAGIAVSIFSSQVKDLLGLDLAKVPADFLSRWEAYAHSLPSFSAVTVALSVASIAVIALLRRWRPNWPGFLIVVVTGAVVATFANLPVDTIGSRFGGIPDALPAFAIPHIPFDRLGELVAPAFTIAFLAGVESLLSAVVADGMIGGRHRSNCELVAQGVANIGSALFGGLPATGAIARTATNIRAGARTPVAGMLHAVFLLAFMLLLAPLIRYVPLATLAAILVIVAWNMAEFASFRHLMTGPFGDRIVLLLTFGLTVAFDLTIAIQVGVVLAAFLFMHRMGNVVAVGANVKLLDYDQVDVIHRPDPDQRAQLPPGVEAFQISGPLFFAVASRLDEVLDHFTRPPRVFILRMRLVPLIDSSGVTALAHMLERFRRSGTRVIFSGLDTQPRTILADMGIHEDGEHLWFVQDFADAVKLAEQWVARSAGGDDGDRPRA